MLAYKHTNIPTYIHVCTASIISNYSKYSGPWTPLDAVDEAMTETSRDNKTSAQASILRTGSRACLFRMIRVA